MRAPRPRRLENRRDGGRHAAGAVVVLLATVLVRTAAGDGRCLDAASTGADRRDLDVVQTLIDASCACPDGGPGARGDHAARWCAGRRGDRLCRRMRRGARHHDDDHDLDDVPAVVGGDPRRGDRAALRHLSRRHGRRGRLDGLHRCGTAYAHLVGVPSAELSDRLLVAPGAPDLSWLVQKLDGTQAAFDGQCVDGSCGGTMPLGETPLPTGVLAALRTWIAGGAIDDCP